jgi:allophanate hydrolase subunit 1
VIERLGDRAIRFARPASSSARAIVGTASAWPGVVDVVVTPGDVAIYFAEAPIIELPSRAGDVARAAVIDAARIAELDNLGDDAEPPRDIELAAIYDGPDLADIARATGIADIAALHAAQVYTVEFMGFAPGFAYLTGLPPQLHLPRRDSPRTHVPAGSLAIAAGYTAVYPFDSPGGWHLIGRVDEPMFGPAGSYLRLGDRVRFVRR